MWLAGMILGELDNGFGNFIDRCCFLGNLFRVVEI